MAPSVFISHDTEEDGELAHRLADGLRAAGAEVWIAPDSIGLGESFSAAISRGLEASTAFLVLLTPRALGSAWVRAEIDAAIDLEKDGALSIVPVRKQQTVVPALLRAYQSVSFDGDLDHLVSDLGSALGITPRTPGESETTAEDAIVDPPFDVDAGPQARAMFRALAAGADAHRYLVAAVPRDERSRIAWIVERELLRLGVVPFESDEEPDGSVLDELAAELRLDLHGAQAVIGVRPGLAPEIVMYGIDPHDPAARPVVWREDRPDTNPTARPSIATVRWGPGHDPSALVLAIDLVLKVVRHSHSRPPTIDDPFVDAAIRSVEVGADALGAQTELPHSDARTIVRLVVEARQRIGLVVWPERHGQPDVMLTELRSELGTNELGVDALLAVHSAPVTTQQIHHLSEHGPVDAVVLGWSRRSGPEALRLALQQLMDGDHDANDDPVDPEATLGATYHHGRADAFLEAGDPIRALLDTEEAIDLDPHLMGPYAARAHALALLGRHDAALATLERALALDRHDPSLLFERAYRLLEIGRADEALADLDAAIEAGASGECVDAVRAEVLTALGRHAEALAVADEALAAGVDGAPIHAVRAGALLALGRPEQAAVAAARALERDPQIPLALDILDTSGRGSEI